MFEFCGLGSEEGDETWFAYYSKFLHLVAKGSDRGAGVVGRSQFELMLPSEPPRELCTLRCSLGSYCRPYALLLAVLPAAARLQGNIVWPRSLFTKYVYSSS